MPETTIEVTLDGPDLEPFRRELTGYCYRMLGAISDAEDAVQDTFVRAWRGWERFEGRSSLRTWLYRIATNVCLDAIGGRQRRARPVEIGPLRTAAGPLGDALPEDRWLQPAPDSLVTPEDADPAELAVARETIRLAFVAALQHLPPRQRAVLILRDVLRWRAAEVAELLDTTVVSVNSALQRARETLVRADGAAAPTHLGAEEEALLDRYVEAFERYDIDALTRLLHEDATMSMPPYELWLRGPDDIAAWHLGPGAECRGSRMVATRANGQVAFGQYRPSGPNGEHEPWSLQVVETDGARITALNAFLDVTELFPRFGLPETLEPH